jgi:SAM-dependent methyltransferase
VRAPESYRSIEALVGEYYSRSLATYGPSHRGVDWSSRESQEVRFATLLGGVDWSEAPSLLDYGCGYGALADHLEALGVSCRYVGYDVAPEMIEAARSVAPPRSARRFTCAPDDLEPADIVVASGIFNVKLDTPHAAWLRYVGETIATLAGLARRRLAFNMLPPASAPELVREHLHYADREAVLTLCRETLGGDVELREHYGLWEFTVVVTWDER